jgi:hypothetical protein
VCGAKRGERHSGPRCPVCAADLTDYFKDDLVYLKGESRPFCSRDCVVAAYRADEERARRREMAPELGDRREK